LDNQWFLPISGLAMNIVFIELDRCIACRSCEHICRLHQSALRNGDEPNIFVHVDMDQRQIFAGTCLQCETALCMQVCPVGALARDSKTGAVDIDKRICIGCGMCVVACPYGYMHLDSAIHRASKCNLCAGDPKCVQVCMAKALHFGTIDELVARKCRQHDLLLGVRALPDMTNAKEESDTGNGQNPD
jgi:carbon-monoxide dehydrogenase iron sulfur subunit